MKTRRTMATQVHYRAERTRAVRIVIPVFLCTLLAQDLVFAQTVVLTLDQAVQQAVQKYPAVRSSLEQVSAAAAQIRMATLKRLCNEGCVNL